VCRIRYPDPGLRFGPGCRDGFREGGFGGLGKVSRSGQGVSGVGGFLWDGRLVTMKIPTVSGIELASQGKPMSLGRVRLLLWCFASFLHACRCWCKQHRRYPGVGLLAALRWPGRLKKELHARRAARNRRKYAVAQPAVVCLARRFWVRWKRGEADSVVTPTSLTLGRCP
jgi:hypothetical protein